jgi:hypothetical protein
MNNLISLLSSNAWLSATESSSETLTLPQLSPEMMSQISAGQQGILQILSDAEGNVRGQLSFDTQEFWLDLEPSFAKLGAPSLAVVADSTGQLLRADNVNPLLSDSAQARTMQAPKTDAAPSVITWTDKSQTVVQKAVEIINRSIEPLDAAKYVQNMLQAQGVASQAIKQLLPDKTLLNVALSDIGATVESTAVLTPLNNVLQQLSETGQPQNFEAIKTELTQVLKDLTGQSITGVVASRTQDITLVNTPLGQTRFQSNVKLPEAEPLTLTVQDVVLPQAEENGTIWDGLAKLLLADTSSTENLQTALQQIRSQPQFGNLAQFLETQSPQTAEAIVNRLPLSAQNLIDNIARFYKAAVTRDVGIWLDKNNIESLNFDAKNAPQIVQQIQDFVSSSVKETPAWRIVEVPFFDGNQMSNIKIATPKEQENKQAHPSEPKGTRFIVETDFSKLGQFQFDGFVRKSQRNLDLVVRTSMALDDDFCANIINLFKKSLYNLDYSGTIKLNRQENFVALYQDKPIMEGFYI